MRLDHHPCPDMCLQFLVQVHPGAGMPEPHRDSVSLSGFFSVWETALTPYQEMQDRDFPSITLGNGESGARGSMFSAAPEGSTTEPRSSPVAGRAPLTAAN